MEYVTYLLGAGASCGEKIKVSTGGYEYESMTGLPIISTMLERFKLRKEQCLHDGGPHTFIPFSPINSINEDLRENLLELYVSLISHYEEVSIKDNLVKVEPVAGIFATIDTYLKSLFHTNKLLFESLKLQLDQFFILEQMVWNVFDHRYLNLITTISNLTNLPKNCNFITWNYDFMMQEVADRYVAREYSQGQNGWMSSPGLVNSYPAPGNYEFEQRALDDNWSLVCLNGRAGIYIETEPTNHIMDITLSMKFLNNNERVDFILNEYPKKERMLTFAWENRRSSSIYQKPEILLEKHLEETTILVIVGYSFPFFNRHIDSKIFEHAKKLKKVVYQQPNNRVSAKFLIDRFNLDERNIKIEDEFNCSQFYIPVEL